MYKNSSSNNLFTLKTIVMKIKISTIQLLLIVMALCLPALLHAQGPGFGDDTDDVPIDGGLTVLLAAGVGYGVKKMRNAKAKLQDK